MDQCSLGWTSNVVLTGDCGSGNGLTAWAHAHRLRRRLHLANAGLSFMADCSALCVGREVLDSILGGEDAFESKPMLQVGGVCLLNRLILIYNFIHITPMGVQHFERRRRIRIETHASGRWLVAGLVDTPCKQ